MASRELLNSTEQLDGYHRHELKGNGLPTGWRNDLDGETIYRQLNRWTCVVRVAHEGERGPFVVAARRDSAGQWFRLEGQRALEDAIARADEIMTSLDELA